MHSLHRLAPCLKGCGRFCLTTVDTVFDPTEFDHYIDAYAADTGTYDGYMGVTTYIDDEKPLYISADREGTVTGYFDTPVEGADYISGGIYALPESALEILDECMAAGKTRMRDFQRALVASGMRLKAWPFRTHNRHRPRLRHRQSGPPPSPWPHNLCPQGKTKLSCITS